MKAFCEVGFGRYRESEVLETLRASGGGDESLIVSYQEITGTLSPGAHAGSYNGQDAWNGMLVTDENHNDEPQRYAHGRDNGRDSERFMRDRQQRPADRDGDRGVKRR